MASIVYRRAGVIARVQARLTPCFFRQLTSGSRQISSQQTHLDLEEDDHFVNLKIKKPKRRWMSVTDLVTEVERSMVQGLMINKDGDVYANLVAEAERVRTDNDFLNAEVQVLKSTRAENVVQEDKLTKKLNEAGSFSALERDIVDVVEKIKETDLNLASLQCQRQQNIRDVGHLKRTMSRIQKRSDIRSLVHQVEEALDNGRVLSEDGVEAAGLNSLLEKLRGEFDRVEPKIVRYEQEMVGMDNNLQAIVPRIRSPDISSSVRSRLRWDMLDDLKHSKRMLAQCTRLRDIQILNTQEINIIERALSKLHRSAKIHKMIASGDNEQIKDKVNILKTDIDSLRRQMKDIEAKLQPHAQESFQILEKLRTDKNVFNAKSGKLREELIANLHQEESWKKRLAVLRGEKMQNIRFTTLLEAALANA